ncbi:Hypothetical protein A7982_06234 [Minicystis rosea]|nr:Hypothetical protein A7982_06234 [Minicystis rosea]
MSWKTIVGCVALALAGDVVIAAHPELQGLVRTYILQQLPK